MCKIGLKSCSKWLRNKYRQAVKGICQECKKPESEVGILEPHRIKRKNKGGTYTLFPLNHPKNNVKVVCKSCHKKYHSNEFTNVKSN